MVGHRELGQLHREGGALGEERRHHAAGLRVPGQDRVGVAGHSVRVVLVPGGQRGQAPGDAAQLERGRHPEDKLHLEVGQRRRQQREPVAAGRAASHRRKVGNWRRTGLQGTGLHIPIYMNGTGVGPCPAMRKAGQPSAKTAE